MAQAATAQKSETSTGPTSFNLMKWIAENPDKLKPPVSAKTIFAGLPTTGWQPR